MKLTKRKGFNFFRSYFDVYNELEKDSDKLDFIEALFNRQFLGIKPTELKGMAKFAYISQTNSIDSQVKGYEDKTKTKLNPLELNNYTPTVGGCVGVNKKDFTPTLQVEEKGKGKGEEKEKEKDIKTPQIFNFRKTLIELNGDEELITDWLMVRKNKKATNSKTALNSFLNQVKISKKDLNFILELCVSKSWSSFNSSWDYADKVSGKFEKGEVQKIINKKITF